MRVVFEGRGSSFFSSFPSFSPGEGLPATELLSLFFSPSCQEEMSLPPPLSPFFFPRCTKRGVIGSFPGFFLHGVVSEIWIPLSLFFLLPGRRRVSLSLAPLFLSFGGKGGMKDRSFYQRQMRGGFFFFSFSFFSRLGKEITSPLLSSPGVGRDIPSPLARLAMRVTSLPPAVGLLEEGWVALFSR